MAGGNEAGMYNDLVNVKKHTCGCYGLVSCVLNNVDVTIQVVLVVHTYDHIAQLAYQSHYLRVCIGHLRIIGMGG